METLKTMKEITKKENFADSGTFKNFNLKKIGITI